MLRDAVLRTAPQHEADPMIVRTIEEALSPISDGCVLAVPRDISGVAMEATRALIRRGIRRLQPDCASDFELAGRSADRRGLRGKHRDLGREPR